MHDGKICIPLGRNNRYSLFNVFI